MVNQEPPIWLTLLRVFVIIAVTTILAATYMLPHDAVESTYNSFLPDYPQEEVPWGVEFSCALKEAVDNPYGYVDEPVDGEIRRFWCSRLP